jgi:hypothetical protein
MVEKRADNGTKYYRVFIHFKTWFNHETASKVRNQLIEGKEIKIIYDEPWFWKVSAYRPHFARPKPTQIIKPRPSAPPSIVLYDERTPQHPTQQKQGYENRPQKQKQEHQRRPQREIKRPVEKENRKTIRQEIDDEKI